MQPRSELEAFRTQPLPAKSEYSRWLAVVFFTSLLLIAVGLTVSRTAITAGIIGVLISGVLHTRWSSLFSNIFSTPILWVPLLWFLSLLVSYVYSENIEEWYFLVRISLPYLLLPLGVGGAFQTLTDTRKLWLYAAFCAGVSVVCLFTLYHYLQDPSYYHNRLIQSKDVPIANGINHLSFGLMHAWAAHLCYTLWVAWKREQRLLLVWGALATGMFLVLCLHIFASRTGVVAFYAALLLRAVAHGWQAPTQRIRMVAGAMLVTALFITLCTTLPSLRNKFQNSVADLQYFVSGARLDDWSLGRRLAAWQTAWHLGLQNPVVGVAPADVYVAMQQQYELEPFRFDDKNLRSGTHNQFLESFAGMGTLGLGVFLCLLFCPLANASVRRQGLAWAFYGILLTGCMTDTMLQAQIGPNFHLLFAYLVLYEIPAWPQVKYK